MSEPTAYEIVLRGRASARLLRPLLDDFSFDHTSEGVTRLTGEIRDAAHLHGVVAHLTSVNAELISIAPRRELTPTAADVHPSNPNHSQPESTEWNTHP